MTVFSSFAIAKVAILLDVDGTILDLAMTPSEVNVPHTLRNTLNRLGDLTKGAVALVSGRPLADLDRIFSPLKLPAIGGHGAEIRRTASAPTTRPSLSIDTLLKEKLIAAVAENILIEDKGYSIAFHYRKAPKNEKSLHKQLSSIVANHPDSGVEILMGKAVMEVKPSRFTKGTGIRNLMNHAPFRDRVPVFIGDDITDEAAFAILPEFNGVGYSVGRRLPGATGMFRDALEVRDWLERLAKAGHIP